MREKVDEIFQLFPLLAKEYESYTTSTDNLKVKFKNGSVFDVVAALDSQRGGRRHSQLILPFTYKNPYLGDTKWTVLSTVL